MSPVSKVFVHIGPLKTGTTFIQAVLYGNRDTLAANGVVLPRETFGQHVRSVLGLMGRKMHPEAPAQGNRQWQLLVDEVKAADAHTAVMSMEFLCTASTQAVRTMVDSLAPAEVHVVYTARDLVKVIPAAWQTLLRNKQAPPWGAWIESVREVAQEAPHGPSGPAATARKLLGRNPDPTADSWGSRLWRQQDPRQVLAPYLEHIPAERVHVVTVPPSGAPPALLWERFCAATGMEPAAYDIDVPRANTSLGGVESEVLRRVNTGVAGRIPGDVYSDLVKHFLAREVLEPRTQSFPLVLPDDERAWVAERAADAIAYFGSGGFRVHGDLDDLVSPPVGPGRRPDDVSETEVLAVMQETLSAVLLGDDAPTGFGGVRGPAQPPGAAARAGGTRPDRPASGTRRPARRPRPSRGRGRPARDRGPQAGQEGRQEAGAPGRAARRGVGGRCGGAASCGQEGRAATWLSPPRSGLRAGSQLALGVAADPVGRHAVADRAHAPAEHRDAAADGGGHAAPGDPAQQLGRHRLRDRRVKRGVVHRRRGQAHR